MGLIGKTELAVWHYLGTTSRDQAMRQMFERLYRDCGIQIYRWHDSRHAFSSNLIAAGVPLVSVAKWAGHSYQVCADTYTHLLEGQSDNHVAALETVFTS